MTIDGPRSIWDAEVQKVIHQPKGTFHPLLKHGRTNYYGKERDYLSNDEQPVSSGSTAPFNARSDSGNAVPPKTPSAYDWQDNGNRWCHGTLTGLATKLGYFKRLGVTAIWIGPVFKQIVTDEHSYHGYAIQNFLEIDPRFGTKEDYKSLVQQAHKIGMYIIQDIICNHVGDVFRYATKDFEPSFNHSQIYPVKGWYDADHKEEHTLPFDQPTPMDKYPEAAIWPQEFQDGNTIFTREGKINDWDTAPEYLDGDFYSLKDLSLGSPNPDSFVATPALKALVECYKYWIAFADLDAFRLDTVKHMGWGPTRYFCNAIHELASSIGKEKFMIVGEITGNAESKYATVTETGLNAALGITDLQELLWKVPRGEKNPKEYFDMFRNATYLKQGSHAWLRDKLVTMLDDHDQVWRGGNKGRFASVQYGKELLFPALAMNLTTLGIPCIYYGSEQGFDGSGGEGLDGHGADQWIRECMFGGRFGAFRSQGRHFFNENNSIYREVARVAQVRKDNMALTRGRQYLREISTDGETFWYPAMLGAGRMTSVVAWSRVFNGVEIVCAISTDVEKERSVWVTVDAEIHKEGDVLHALYEIETSASHTSAASVERKQDGRAAVLLTVPAAGFVMFMK